MNSFAFDLALLKISGNGSIMKHEIPGSYFLRCISYDRSCVISIFLNEILIEGVRIHPWRNWQLVDVMIGFTGKFGFGSNNRIKPISEGTLTTRRSVTV